MKLRQVLSLVGITQQPKTYGHEIRTQDIHGQQIQYAQWLHPKAYACAVQDAELKRLQSFLNPGDVVIDIGAHMGDTTLPMALSVGLSGTVIAFEPNAFVFPVLAENAKLNPNSMNIRAYQIAITEDDRDVEFSYGDPGFMNGGSVERTRWFRWGNSYTQIVQGMRLDRFVSENYPTFIDKIRYVKIDAEGYDYFVLKSMPRIIEASRPFIQAEIMRRTPRAYRDGIYELLTQNRYRIERHLSGRNGGTPLARADMYFADNFDIFCTPQ
jgi:FkbM family methyltransferase